MILLSTLTRSGKEPKGLKKLLDYRGVYALSNSDAPSIYEGHSKNVKLFIQDSFTYLLDGQGVQDDDIFILCHDDIEIMSSYKDLKRLLSICKKPGVGFVGVAGSTRFDKEIQGMWWNARHSSETRGFVFQGEDELTMTPNYFGRAGQVVVLDGCFLACSFKVLKDIGLEKPSYLSSNWDFYDIHLTSSAFLKGYSNYAVPIIIRHESDGHMRPEWFTARDEFFKHHAQNLPLKLPVNSTHGLPV